MNRAMYVAASGMAAQEAQLDAVADNLANADVAGFRAGMLRFRPIGDGSGGGLGMASLPPPATSRFGSATRFHFRRGLAVSSNGSSPRSSPCCRTRINRVTRLVIGDRTLVVDSSGSYRVD